MPKLDEYRRKRDFTKTAEPPPGDPDAEARNLVFVVQQHAAYRAGMHWDFRLEVDGVLKSWPLRKPPPVDPKQKVGATMVEDHPYDYRTYEGVIPKGEYGGGQVIVWDEGIISPDEGGETAWNDKAEGSRRLLEEIERGKVSFTMRGSKLKGSYALIKTSYGPKSWLLIKHRDEFAREGEDLSAADVSVRSGLTIQDLKDGRMPPPETRSKPMAIEAPESDSVDMPRGSARGTDTSAARGTAPIESLAGARQARLPDAAKERPMLATLVDKAFDRPGWVWEPKLDGIRILAYGDDGKVTLRSRRGVDVTKTYPSLVKDLEKQPARSFVLDGEICALDENGVPRFQLIQPRINLTKTGDIAYAETQIPIVYFAFDLLYLDGYDLRGVALRERRELLESMLQANGRVQLVAQIDDGPLLVEVAKQTELEGVVGKRFESRYEYGARSQSWLKVKTVQLQEFVVGGYTPGEGARAKSFGALAVGYYDDGDTTPDRKLHYAGNVGSGFRDAELTATLKLLQGLQTDVSPFDGPAEGKVTYVEPKLIAQVKFTEITKDGRLRAPVFLGLRDDIVPAEVRREEPLALDEVVLDAEDDLLDSEDEAPDAGPELMPRGSARGTATLPDAISDSDNMPRSSGRGTQRSPDTNAPAADNAPASARSSKVSRLASPSSRRTSAPATANGPHSQDPALVQARDDVLRQLENPKANFVIEADGQDVKLTNLDKVFWPAYKDTPALTKRDLIRFYVELSPTLVPHLRDRPLTLTRYPNGVAGSLFYQKHYAQPIPAFVSTVPIWSSSNDADGTYIMCNNLPTLVWLAQIADLELHAWMSRVDPEPDSVVDAQTFDGSEKLLDASVLNYPDYMIFDLDPYIYSGQEAKGAEPEFNRRGWEKTVEIALSLKELLDQMRLSSYVKTSGKTGLHVYVPILRHYDFDEVRSFTATIGKFLLQVYPKDVTMEWDTSKRNGKVFFDHNQNTRGKTLAAQYSLRPTAWAGVSTPLTWTELPSLDPATLNIRTVPARVAELGDLWWDVLERKNDIDALLGG